MDQTLNVTVAESPLVAPRALVASAATWCLPLASVGLVKIQLPAVSAVTAPRMTLPSRIVTTLPAVAGYPHLTVPAGWVAGLPIGLSFFGPAKSDARLLGLGSAFERATHHRKAPQA